MRPIAERRTPRAFAAIAALSLAGWCAAAAAQQVAPPVSEPFAAWPATAPSAVRSSPDWSDYRIYPAAARRKNAEGGVTGEVLIAADGKPVACRIVQGSGSAELDDGTCALMMQMRFEPAHDASGAATQSSFKRRILWLLDDPRPFASGTIEAKIELDAEGKPACQVVRADGPYAAVWSAVACSFFGDTEFYLHNAGGARRFIVVARLDAGDQANVPGRAWPTLRMVAQEKIVFGINKEGDPVGCTAELQSGFGPRGLNNLSPCGRLLSILWLRKAFGKRGTMETRVYALDSTADGDRR